MKVVTKTIKYYKRYGLGRTLRQAPTAIFFYLFVYRLKFFGLTYVPSRYGFYFKKNWNDVTFKFYIKASYGFFLFDLLLKHDDKFIFFDIGANQGVYTLAADKNPLCQQVFAFEPVAKTFNLLKSNVDKNSGSNKVHLVDAAISDTQGTSDVIFEEHHSGCATLANTNSASGLIQKIKTINSAELNKLNIPDHIEIIVKIDVEGHEQVVIEELTKLKYWLQITVVFYEIDTRWSSSAKIEQILRENGFNYFKKIGGGKNHYDVLASRSIYPAPKTPN